MFMFKPVIAPDVVRLSEVVTRQLESMISQGLLNPGEGLPAERELAKRLGVSRPSLREALSSLRSRGLIERARKGSAVVTDLTGPALTDPLFGLLGTHPDARRDVLELRFGLEAHASFLAAARATDADIAKIETALRASFGRRTHNPALLAKRDLAFHRAIVEGSHNLALLHTFHGLSKLTVAHVQRGYEMILASPSVREDRAELVRNHTAIFDAIRHRDSDGAWLAAYDHLRFTELVWAGR
jgi:GntR family transcriptional repressor for pyruvate dehydrogenase complex